MLNSYLNQFKKVTTLVLILLISACSCNPYGKVGVGYKVDETEVRYNGKIADDPYSARFELGKECKKYTYGVSHHSQWMSGAPFNNDGEYQKTEVFIDYKFDLSEF